MKKKRSVSIILMGTLINSMFSVPTFAADKQTVVSQILTSEMSFATNSEHVGAGIDKAFDSNDETFWDSAWSEGDKGLGEKPIYINIEFKTPKDLEKFVYTPRQDDNPNGMILEYSLTGIMDNGQEKNIVNNGVWANNHADKEVIIEGTDKFSALSLAITKGSFLNTTSETAATAAEFTVFENKQVLDISADSLALKEGTSRRLSLMNTDESVIWSSSNPNVANVDTNGMVLAQQEGTATITATTESGNSAVCEISVSSEEAPEIEGMKLVFQDDFEGDSLDTSKWNNWCVDLKGPGLFRYGNSPDVVVHPDNAYINDGTLRLLGSKEITTFDGITSNYRSGMVQTRDKFESTYGYIEAMVKIPNVAGSNPAVWMMPQMNDETGEWLWGDANNFGAEIDILERPHPEGSAEYAGLVNKYWITMHYDNYTYNPHEKYHVQPVLNDPYKWHKFGIEWTPDNIKFMLDGKVVAVQNENVPNMSEIFILSYGLGGWIGQITEEDLPAEMQVDYVRWYQPITN